MTRAESIRRGFFRSRFRNRTAATHCGHALDKPGAPIGAPSSEPLLAVHARTCRPAVLSQLLAPLRSPGLTEIGFAPETIAPCHAICRAFFLSWRNDDRLPDIARARGSGRNCAVGDVLVSEEVEGELASEPSRLPARKRTSRARTLTEIRSLARSHSRTAIRVLVGIMRSAEATPPAPPQR